MRAEWEAAGCCDLIRSRGACCAIAVSGSGRLQVPARWQLAISAIAHVPDLVVVVDALIVTHHREVAGQFLAGVDLVDHRLEVDRFGCVARRPLADVRDVRAVAQKALLDRLPVADVEEQHVVAGVALLVADDLAARDGLRVGDRRVQPS